MKRSAWLLLCLAGCAAPMRGSLVAVPSMTGTLPDGTPVMQLIVVPRENIAWGQEALRWREDWPAQYEVLTKQR